MWATYVVVVALSLAFTSAQAASPMPVVLWHGMGDTCCNPLSMGRIQKIIEANVPGVYVLSLRIGNSTREDQTNGFLLDVNTQIDMACKMIAADSTISSAGRYNAIGFSQGGQFLRAVAERCPSPLMSNLISIGGQHQGVYGFPKCPGDDRALCDFVRKMLNKGAYIPAVQDTIVQAQYWHDPLDEQTYVEKSVFLADINQERGVNLTYKANFLRINNFVLVKFTEDTMVQPVDSEWFGFYVAGQSKEVYNYTQSALYQQDWIGLKTMDQQGRVKFLSVVGDHLQFSDQWFIENIIDAYLK